MEFIELCFYLLCIAGIFGICFIFPIKYNKFFEEKYGVKAVNWPISIVIGCLIFAAFLEQHNTFVFIIILFLIIASYILSGIYCYSKTKELGADITDIVVAITAQIFSSFGVAFLVIILVDYFSGRKRKRRK
ncbi:MAG: hypothetical protein J6J07_08490 [Oscillospiraceae bacterium]|nr:hypothetical protein [Oscillospiraceae bacterium]